MRSSTRVTDADLERLERYLRREAADGDAYIKGKFIADEVDLTRSERKPTASAVGVSDSSAGFRPCHCRP